MSESYDFSLKIGDIYDLKDGVKVRARDVAVFTGSFSANGKPEVDKMGAGYDPNKVIGIFENSIDKETAARPNEPLPYPHDEIVVLKHGASQVIVTEAVNPANKLMGASNQITEYFDGDGTAQQQITVANVPVDSVVSVTEDPTGSPTVLTQVPLSQTPSTDEYNYNPTTGVIEIGGTSVSGTDNYEVVYSVDSGRMKILIEEMSESLSVTSDIATLNEQIDYPLMVKVTAGTSTGHKTPVYSGTPAAGEVLIDRDNNQLEFAAADAASAVDVVYKTNYKPKAEALEVKAAGELCRIFVDIE